MEATSSRTRVRIERLVGNPAPWVRVGKAAGQTGPKYRDVDHGYHPCYTFIQSIDTRWPHQRPCNRPFLEQGYEDPHKTLPSVVVHVRGLVDGVTEADLVEALQEFGAIRY